MKGAPVGNKFALGNRGGQPYSKDNREKAATLKGLVIDWAIEAMKNGNEQMKKEVVLKILGTCIPTNFEGDINLSVTYAEAFRIAREARENSAESGEV